MASDRQNKKTQSAPLLSLNMNTLITSGVVDEHEAVTTREQDTSTCLIFWIGCSDTQINKTGNRFSI